MPSLHQDRKWLWGARAALFVYVLLAVLMIVQRPGLYYDEALMVLGAVHMRHSPTELTVGHDAQTWVCARGHCFPLMTMSYIGAIKEYVSLPFFVLFGPRTEVIRLVSVLFTLFCVWGIGRLIGEQIHPAAGAAAALAIAINPAFVDMTVFDNGAVAVWMVALGLVCAALAHYFRQPGFWPAFCIGAAMGLGVWARANFVWLILAILGAAVLVLRKKLRAPPAHWLAWVAGGVVGGLPFLIYQIHSRGGSWKATSIFLDSGTRAGRLPTRFFLFAETLLADLEHRAMWNGPWMPRWQHWLLPAIVLFSMLVCLIITRGEDRVRSQWAQASALTFLFLALFFFLTDLRVSEHHLITLVPPAVIVTVLACCILQTRFHWGKFATGGIALVYAGSALYWQIAAIQGLHRTRGVGPWSNGIYTLARQLVDKYPGRDIKALDWGLGFNLYVLTDGRLHPLEIYSENLHVPWIDEIRNGGVFLLNGPEHRQVPESSIEFLRVLARARPVMQRFTIPQRDGTPFAEIIEIQSGTVQPSVSPTMTRGPQSPEQLDGFYPPETAGWSWSKREFSATFIDDAGIGRGDERLVLELFVADVTIQKLGAITLRARLGDHVLGPETYSKPGKYTFRRDLESGWLRPGVNRFDFSLDKALSPEQADGRELGIVVTSVSLEPR